MRKELKNLNSVVPRWPNSAKGNRVWDKPLKRRNTWTIYAPDATILAPRYRNEPEIVR